MMPAPSPRLTRRRLIAGLSLAGAGLVLPLQGCGAPLSAPPRMRPPPTPTVTGEGAEAIVARARLSGTVSFLVVDRASGAVIESRAPDQPLPPASVAKTATTLYAMAALGGRYRFATRLMATGPVAGGRIRGDLVLAGGGDPALDTDRLAGLAAQLRAAGVTGLEGRFLVWGGALPRIDRIDPGQPPHLGYNAAISGLNLNFNRVNFGWQRQASGLAITLDAPGERFNAPVAGVRMRAVDRDAPLFTYADGGAVENWTVAARKLPPRGSRWLPVRHPPLYAGEVFRGLARQSGVSLPAPQEVDRLPGGTVIATLQGEELALVLRDMLRHSNNLIAEVSGLTASAAAGAPADTLAASAATMTGWLRQRYGLADSRFADHSGLGAASRATAADLVRLLAAEGPLPGLLKPVESKGNPAIAGQVVAKTGTLNFVSALAGYLTPASGRRLCFAILTADEDRRDQVAPEDREAPPGAREWEGRSRAMQRALLARWSGLPA